MTSASVSGFESHAARNRTKITETMEIRLIIVEEFQVRDDVNIRLFEKARQLTHQTQSKIECLPRTGLLAEKEVCIQYIKGQHVGNDEFCAQTKIPKYLRVPGIVVEIDRKGWRDFRGSIYYPIVGS